MAVDVASLNFVAAVVEAGQRGDYSDLIKLLDDDYPLTAEDKRCLADLFRGKIRPKLGRPRIREGAARDLDRAVVRVKYIKHLMRQRGQRYRIHDQAIGLAREWLERDGFPAPSPQSIGNALRRSRRPQRSRRKVAR